MVVMEEGSNATPAQRRTCTIHLLTAHRDQSSSKISGWFPGSGVPLRAIATPSQADGPVVSRCDLNSTTVAGAAPEFDRLPNSPPRRHKAAPEMARSNHDSRFAVGMKTTSHPCGRDTPCQMLRSPVAGIKCCSFGGSLRGRNVCESGPAQG